MRIVGQYVLHDAIAAGGMASVHLGQLRRSHGFARTVAIKCLRAEFANDDRFKAMFMQEARLAARIQHPHVVPVHDVVEENGELLLVMDYVHGVPLSQLLESARATTEPMPPAIACAIVAGVLHGLDAAHEARGANGEALGIVHRDVSPQNVIVGTDGIARVLDFGVAKAFSQFRCDWSTAGGLKGKPRYMAPEHLRGEAIDRRADIYAAAVILWEALTGQRRSLGTGRGLSIAELILSVISLPPAPSTLVMGVPQALDAIVLRGLANDPAHRFSSAAEMARAVEQAMPPASRFAIAAWVAKIGKERILLQDKALAKIENASPEAEVPVAPAPAPVDEEATDIDGILGAAGAADVPVEWAEAPPAPPSIPDALMVTIVPPRKRSRSRIWLWAAASAALAVAALVAHPPGAARDLSRAIESAERSALEASRCRLGASLITAGFELPEAVATDATDDAPAATPPATTLPTPAPHVHFSHAPKIAKPTPLVAAPVSGPAKHDYGF